MEKDQFNQRQQSTEKNNDFEPQQKKSRERKRLVAIIIILVAFFAGYFLWIITSPLGNKKIAGNTISQFLCKIQSIPPLYDCTVKKKTTCSNLGCISAEDYNRCIKPALKDDGSWDILPASGCTLPSLTYMRSKWTEPCQFGYYKANRSLEDLGFGSVTDEKAIRAWHVSVDNSNQQNANLNTTGGVASYNASLVCDNPVNDYLCSCETARL